MKRWFITVMAVLVGLLMMGGLATATAEPRLPKPNSVRRTNDGPPSTAIPRLESVYVPIRPCRIADTRASSAGTMRHSTTRPFYVRGTTGFAGQGGTSTGCGIPAGATGVTVNTTVTNVTGSGFMTNFPTGTAQPLSNFVFYNRNVTQTSNPTFALAPAGTEPSVQVRTSGGGDADLVIDVTGYYLPQIEALVTPTGSIYAGSPRVLSGTHTATGVVTVHVDSDVTYCTPVAHPYYADEYATAEALTGSDVTVRVWNLDSSTHAETPVDDYFYLTVTC